MRTFVFKDADNLASGEIANVLVIHARTRQAAVALYQWYYKMGYFNRFGKVSFTNATFTTASKTLTLASAFTRYVFANSTRIIISSGTGVTAGEYVIASRSSDNAIVLSTDIGGTNPSDVTGYIIGGRTATLIERTNSNPLSVFPGNAYGTDGVSLSKGVAPNESQAKALFEIPITCS